MVPRSPRLILAGACAAMVLAACGPRPAPEEPATSQASRRETAVPSRREPAAGADGSTRAMGAAPAAVPGVRNPLAGLPGTAATPVDDARISARVRSTLAAERELQGLRIDVDCNGGVVTLSGPVPSLALKARAAELARQVPEVQSVNDQLTLVAS